MTPPWHANEFHNIQFNSLSSSISTYIHVSVFVLSSLGIRPPLIAPGRFGILQESYLAKCQTCQEQWEAAAFPDYVLSYPILLHLHCSFGVICCFTPLSLFLDQLLYVLRITATNEILFLIQNNNKGWVKARYYTFFNGIIVL